MSLSPWVFPSSKAAYLSCYAIRFEESFVSRPSFIKFSLLALALFVTMLKLQHALAEITKHKHEIKLVQL